jgi:hypothetical protein
VSDVLEVGFSCFGWHVLCSSLPFGSEMVELGFMGTCIGVVSQPVCTKRARM